MRQALQRQPVDKPKAYEQDVIIGMVQYKISGGREVSSGVTEALVAAAQKKLASGAIKDIKDLAELRQIALADDTISDQERLFLAALLDSTNADRIKAVNLKSQEGRDLKLRFTLDDATAKRLRDVADIGRPASAGKGDEKTQMTTLAGRAKGAKGRIAKLVAFANDRKVPLGDVVEAMRAAASDSTPGDMLAAGAVYAIAAAASHPLAADLKAGKIKVDEMELEAGKKASYMPTATGDLRKGDTIYVQPSFDVGDLSDRETAIHELEHAKQDKAESGLVVKSGGEVEPDAYVAGAKYAMTEIAALPKDKQDDQVKKLAKAWAEWDMYAAAIAAKTDATKLGPVLKAINAARPKKERLDDSDFAKPDSELKEWLVLRLGASAREKVGLSGFSGESWFDVRRTLKRP